MLSAKQLKKIDPNLANLTDKEIDEIRSAFYDLVQLIFDDWLENGHGSKYPTGVLQRLQDANRIEVCKTEEPKQA